MDLDTAGDTDSFFDVFVRNRTGSTTTRQSVGTGGALGDGDSINPSISSDGAKVAFDSVATNLTNNDNNGASDVFIRQGSTTSAASVISSGTQVGDRASSNAALSGDGLSIAFQSASGQADTVASR